LVDLASNMIPKNLLISAVIIARNEQTRIAECISHLTWASEILVIDNGSDDDTISVAKRHGATVIVDKTKDFAQIRNKGVQAAGGKWVLYVDADETVTDALREEILRIIHGDTASVAFFIPRKNYYLGAPWPTKDGMVRLILKKALVSWKGILHEHPQVNGHIGKTNNYFIHHTHRTLSEMVEKTNEWSASEAKLRLDHGHPTVSWWRLLRVMVTGFLHSYIKENGWRAGTVGLIESMYQGFSMFITYAKLWELQKERSTKVS
jgi:glycosyltransferase involved in cell wall biosynthesis